MPLSILPEYDSSQAKKKYDQAVVIGGGFAGLSTARILADYCTRVVVLERDSPPESPRPRRGVPQDPHGHTLFPAGATVLNELLPGYGDDLLEGGAVENDSGSDWNYYYDSENVRADTPSRISSYNATRPLLEQTLRRQVATVPAVDIRTSHQFLEYLTSESDSVVTGVLARNKTAEEEEITADLVVDATGRTSKTVNWLERHGYSAPPKQEMEVDVAYSTGYIERPPDDVRGIIVEGEGGSVGFTPVEGERWQFWLTGRGENHPPTDPTEMERVAEEFGVPVVDEVLEKSDWVDDDVAHYRFPSSRRYRYEELDRFPEGLLVIGDAVASFNPIFGQGMTVAILEGLVLHHVLAESEPETLAGQFFEMVQPVIDLPWFMVTAVDSHYQKRSEKAPPGAESYIEYQEYVRQTAAEDGRVAETLLRTGQLHQPLSSLLQPSIVSRVFDDSEGTAVETGPPDWTPPALEDAWGVLEDNLTDPESIGEWPGVPETVQERETEPSLQSL